MITTETTIHIMLDDAQVYLLGHNVASFSISSLNNDSKTKTYINSYAEIYVKGVTPDAIVLSIFTCNMFTYHIQVDNTIASGVIPCA